MKITIRRAIDSDIDWIIGELRKFSKFIGTKNSFFGDEEYSKNGLLGVIKNHVLFVAESSSEKLGFIGGIFTPHLFNPNLKILCELFWWVDEKFRNTRAGLMLLNEFISFGKTNADVVTMTLEHNSPVNEKTITKRGFRLNEVSYILEA